MQLNPKVRTRRNKTKAKKRVAMRRDCIERVSSQSYIGLASIYTRELQDMSITDTTTISNKL